MPRFVYIPNEPPFDPAIHFPHPTLSGIYLDREGCVYTSLHSGKTLFNPSRYFIRLSASLACRVHRVNVPVDGVRKSLGVARLVLETFVGPADGREAWHHSARPDGEPADALRWVFWSEARPTDKASALRYWMQFPIWCFAQTGRPHTPKNINTPFTLRGLYEAVNHPALTPTSN